MSGFIDDTDGISFSEIRQAFNSIYFDKKTGSIRLSDFVGETTTDSVDNILTIPRNNLSLRQYFRNKTWIPELLYTLRDTDGTNDRFTFRNKDDVFATTGDSLSEVRSRLNIDANSSTLSSDERWWNDNDYFKMATKSVDGVTETMNGYQVWTVPKTGYYRITALGAMGGGSYETITPGTNEDNIGGGSGSDYCHGGYSVEMSGVYRLLAGEKLLIIVGKKGEDYPWPRSSGNVTVYGTGVKYYLGRSMNSFYEDPAINYYAHNMTKNDKVYGAGGGGGGSFVFMYDETTGINGVSGNINSAAIIVSGGGGGGSKMQYRDFDNNSVNTSNIDNINDYPLVSLALSDDIYEDSEFFDLACATPTKYHPLNETDDNSGWIDWSSHSRGTDHKGISDHGYGLGGKSVEDLNVILDINGKSGIPSGHTNVVLGTRGGFGGGGNSTMVNSMHVGEHKYWEWQSNEHEDLYWVSIYGVGPGRGATAQEALDSYRSTLESYHPYTGSSTNVDIINPGQSSGGGGGGWIGGMGGKGREYGITTQWSKQDSAGQGLPPVRSTNMSPYIYSEMSAHFSDTMSVDELFREVSIRQIGVGIHSCTEIPTSPPAPNHSNLYIYKGLYSSGSDINGETIIPRHHSNQPKSTFGFNKYNTNYGMSQGIKMQYREPTHNRNGWGGGSHYNSSQYTSDSNISTGSANNRLHPDANNTTSVYKFTVKGTKNFYGKKNDYEPSTINLNSFVNHVEFTSNEKTAMRSNGSGRVIIEFISV